MTTMMVSLMFFWWIKDNNVQEACNSTRRYVVIFPLLVNAAMVSKGTGHPIDAERI